MTQRASTRRQSEPLDSPGRFCLFPLKPEFERHRGLGSWPVSVSKMALGRRQQQDAETPSTSSTNSGQGCSHSPDTSPPIKDVRRLGLVPGPKSGAQSAPMSCRMLEDLSRAERLEDQSPAGLRVDRTGTPLLQSQSDHFGPT